MGQHAEGLGQPPARHGVGAETLVKDGKGSGETGIGEIGIKVRQFSSGEHGLVHHAAGRQAGDVKIFQFRQFPRGPFHALAGEIQAALQFLARLGQRRNHGGKHGSVPKCSGCSRAGQDENLHHARHLRACMRAKRVRADGNIASVRQFQPLRGKAFLHKHHGSFSCRRITGQKKLSEPEYRGQSPETAQEIKRKGEKQTCPVAFASS